MISRRLRITFWLGLSLLVPLGLALFVLLGRGVRASSPEPLVHAVPPAPTPTTAASTFSTTNVLGSLEATIEHIYTQVNPAVVNIRVVQRQEVRFPVLPEIPFFGSPLPRGPQEFIRRGLGSGFVWDHDGYIVTNNHLVDGADRITVTFHDGTTVLAKVVGTDPESDLAVVKADLPAERLEPVRMADSTHVKVGQLALAFGNPFGLQSTMTVGFVSALGRILPVESGDGNGPSYTIPDIIQTDAPINPGNSGGMLVDDAGRVIGVTSAIISPMGASVSIGFAIPAAIVQKAVPALIKTGHYTHPWLGVSGISLTPDLAKAMGLKPEQRGGLVVDVIPGSPADKAGLHGSDRQVTIEGEQVRVGGDVIIAMDKQPVTGFDDLVTALSRSTEVDQTISLTVLRHGKEEMVQVTLAARPQTEPSRVQAESPAAEGAWLGIRGLTLTPQVAKAMHLPANQQGVLVERVERGSPAEQAGLRGSDKGVLIDKRRLRVGGDVIVACDEQPVTRMGEFHTLLQRAHPGQKLLLTLLRNGKPIQVAVSLAETPAARS
jgi:serine protease Do